MKHILVLMAAVLLSSCGPMIHVQRKFPNVPEALREPCPDLKQTPATDKLSDVVDVVASNYGQYHACQDKNKKWVQWYDEQKKIFEKVK